jgi:beta-exotoxin I transport system ATP-binding protein
MTSAVETSGLTKTYGATTAVADLSLRIAAGQVFGFLGPNGAGKSTTIRMLLALQRPTKGRATLLGLDAAAGPARALVTIVEYGDFECPYCGQAEPVIRELLTGSK